MLNHWLTAWFCVDHCFLSFLFSPLPLLIYGFKLPIWYLQPFVHCIVRPSLIYGFRLPLCYLQPFDHCIVRPSLSSVILLLTLFTVSDYHFGIFNLF